MTNGKKLQEAARERPQNLPDAKPVDPFGPEWEVFEVRDKMFLLMTEAPGHPAVILKSEPDAPRRCVRHTPTSPPATT